MKDKSRLRRIYNISISLIIVFSFVFGFQSAGLIKLLQSHEKMPDWATRVVSGLAPELYATPRGFSERDLRVLYDVLGHISLHYLYQDEIDEDEIVHGAAAGAVASLGDRYSRFVPPPDQQVLTEEITGEYAGVGISIIDRPGALPPWPLECELDAGGDPEDPEFVRELRCTTVVQVFETGPAYDAGLQTDDVIVCVDGETLRGKNADEAVALIKGPPETTVMMMIWRPETQEELTFEVTRRVVQVPTVGETEMLDDGIGYIRLDTFNNLTPAEFGIAIAELLDDGMEGLILDLRNNTGGPVPAAVGVTDYFIPEGTMVYCQDNMGERIEFPERGEGDGGYALDLPLVVLTNGNTASASEIVAGGIRDTNAGLLVGETTFGKGLVQNVFTLVDGSGLVLTTGVYLTAGGHEISADGLEPDIVSDLDPDRLRELDPEIDSFLTRMEEINEEYSALRQRMWEYVRGHDFQRDTAVEVISRWITTGVMPSSEDFEFTKSVSKDPDVEGEVDEADSNLSNE